MAEEIADLHRAYTLEEVAFQDETFFTHPARIERLADELLRRRLDVPWTATLRADQACRMGETRFATCVRAGLRRVMIGVESGSQETLDRLKKDLRLDQVMTSAEMCARHDVGVIFNFIVGFPDEPDASIDATLGAGQAAARDASAVRDARSSTTGRIRGTRLRTPRATPATSSREDSAAWADFDYVGGRGPWISADTMASDRTIQVLHATGVAAGPLAMAAAAASRWRCDRDWYDFPIEKALVEWVRPPQQVS